MVSAAQNLLPMAFLSLSYHSLDDLDRISHTIFAADFLTYRHSLLAHLSIIDNTPDCS
jgi:hypothetical protein